MNLNDRILRTEKLLLRPFEAGDISEVFRGLSHPQVIKYYGVSFHSLEAAREQMNWFADLQDNDKGMWWAICSPEGTFYGAAGLNNWNHEFRKVELGYWLLPEFWGKGIAGEAIGAVTDYAFSRMNIHRIEAFVESENKTSCKLLSRLGFEREGTMKDCEIKKGAFISLEIFALFAD